MVFEITLSLPELKVSWLSHLYYFSKTTLAMYVLWRIAFVMLQSLGLHYTGVGHIRLGDSSSDWELALDSRGVNFGYPVWKFRPEVQHSYCVAFPLWPLRALARLSPLRKPTSETCFLLSPGRCTGLGSVNSSFAILLDSFWGVN